jgi:hypothetical protein
VSSPYFEYFHSRYTRAELAVFSEANLNGSRSELPASFSCQRTAVQLSFRQTVSAPGRARNRFGASSAENKKPGVERRASPSLSDCHLSDGRNRSKLDVFLSGVRNQPHLIHKRGRLPAWSARPAAKQDQPTSAKYSTSLDFVKSRKFLFPTGTVNFAQTCGKPCRVPPEIQPLARLKNSTWRRRFLASSSVL